MMVNIVVIEGYFLSKAAFPSSLCLFFEDQFRRREITYFTAVRAIRSFYLLLKRRKLFSFPFEEHLCFIMIFGIVSYLYYERPNDLREKSLLDNIWGDN